VKPTRSIPRVFFYLSFTLYGRVSPRNLIRHRPFMSGRNFSKVDHDALRLRTSWSRAPADGVQPGHPFNLPAPATSAAASGARGNRNAAGADGCSHGRFDNSFHPRLGPHRPTVRARRAEYPARLCDRPLVFAARTKSWSVRVDLSQITPAALSGIIVLARAQCRQRNVVED
jgi:hypothetical protein